MVGSSAIPKVGYSWTVQKRAARKTKGVGMQRDNAVKHATVIRDGFKVPLIGIPEDAVLEKCDRCGKTIELSKAKLQDDKILCPDCLKPE